MSRYAQPSPVDRHVDSNKGLALQPSALTSVPWRAVITFVILACALAWLVVLPLWLGGAGLRSPLTGILIPLMMFTPLVSVLVVMFFVQKPRPRPLPEFLGLWPLRPLKRTIWVTVLAIVGSALIVVAGVFLAAGLGLVHLDLTHFSGFAATLEAVTAGNEVPIGSIPIGLIVLLQLVIIPAAAVINGVLTIGEELGWRGYLLPSLRPLGTWPALLISGAVWGLWHSPIILLGYNFAQPNLFGVAMMMGGCILYGVLLGWLRLRTASIWPSVLAHGAFNATAGFLFLVIAANTTADPVATGPLGWVTWIVMALVIIVLIATRQFSKQPRLQRRSVQPKQALPLRATPERFAKNSNDANKHRLSPKRAQRRSSSREPSPTPSQ
jgi:membrane protease YdiL (CAAX protease family)